MSLKSKYQANQIKDLSYFKNGEYDFRKPEDQIKKIC